MTNTKSYPITDKQSWLENRLLDVTSTEVSALFNLNPYQTEFELYHQKKDKVIISVPDSERMMWGRNLEDSIALGFAEKYKMKVEQFDVYMRDPETRMGSSFDYKIVSEEEPMILEIKNVDGLAYRKNWIEHSEDNIEPPEHIALQLQHQLEITGYNVGYIVALVGGNTMKVVRSERDPKIGKLLKDKVENFWERIKSGVPPDVDYTRDAEYMMKNLYNEADANLIMNADEDTDTLIDDYNAINRECVSLEQQKKAIKAQILEKSQGASKIVSKYGTISCSMSKASKGKLITPEMVGTYINPRKSYRMFRFNQPKGI
jgi:putative phage-type endonuclease